MNVWDQVKHQLAEALSSESYENWVARTTSRTYRREIRYTYGFRIRKRASGCNRNMAIWYIAWCALEINGSRFGDVVYHSPDGERPLISVRQTIAEESLGSSWAR